MSENVTTQFDEFDDDNKKNIQDQIKNTSLEDMEEKDKNITDNDGLTEEEKREIKAPPNKQLIMDIGKTKYTVNLYFKQGTGETYKDKILKLIKRETEKI